MFSEALKDADSVPVFKRDDITNKNSFRPVRVFLCVRKST